MKSKRQINRDIGKIIHYPKCWDTGAYPTLACALWEMVGKLYTYCQVCGEPQGNKIKEAKE